MEEKIVIAIIGVGGIALGAILQFVFTRYAESRRHFREMKTNAYVDFVRGASLLNISIQTNDSEKQNEAIKILADTKMRIAIYGSKKVIIELSKYWKYYENEQIPEAKTAFANTISSMRAETSSIFEGYLGKEIEQLLFK